MIEKIKVTFSNRYIKLALVALFFFPVLFINVRDNHDWGGDFAQYINQAKCICEGKNQSETGYIFNEQNPYLGPPSYPIGFPLILAPIYCFYGNNILAFSILISVFLFALSLILVRLSNLYFSLTISILITIAYIYNPWILRFKSSVLSDIPFASFFLLAIYFYLKKFKSDEIQIKNSIILGLLICFSMLIRSIGVVIILGIFVDKVISSIIKKNLRINLFHNPLIIFTTIVFFYTFLNYIIFPSVTEHYSFFSSLLNINQMGEIIKKSFSYNFVLIKNFFSENIIVGFLTIAFFLIGFIKKNLSQTDIVDYILFGYLTVIIIFPAFQGFRFLLPIYPFIIIYIVFGFKSIRLNFKYIKDYYILFIFAIILFFNYYDDIYSIVKSQKTTFAGPQASCSVEAFNFIKSNTDENSVIAFVKPRVLTLYASRRSIGIGIGKSSEEIDKKFNEVGVDYILTVDDYKNAIIEDYIKIYISNIELIWTNERFKLYKRLSQQQNQD
jgi:hypothetical protein